MHILLVTDAYPPEIRSASHLMLELAEGLRDRGYKITVVTSYPKYNLTDELKDKIYGELTIEEGINVIRIKTLPHHKVNFIVRGISQILMPYLFLSKIKKRLESRIDVVVVYSPPLPLAKVGEAIKRKYGAKFILNVQDIFPQNAIDLEVLNNTVLIKFFKVLEKRAYKAADRIVVHSEGNADFICKKNGAIIGKVSVLHNWIDSREYGGIARTNNFRQKYGLENKFVVLFAGVIGPSQGLNLIVKAAKQLETLHDICFLIVGDGLEKEKLQRMVDELCLNNIIFKPFVSKREYPLLVKDADVGLVCLSDKNKTPVVPGKMLGYMAASIPVVAFLNKESDGHKIIKEARCGYSEISGNIEKAGETIMRIYNERDRLKEYGENGFKFVKSNFEKEICLNGLEEFFN
jgi:glycosyltransferase involved in cell wall biosynthesis